MRAFLSKVPRIVGFLANLAGVLAFLGAVYAFIFPAQVAEYAADFEDLLIEARGDVSRIANASETTATNTGETSENTRRLAEAIPNWIKFENVPMESIMPHLREGYSYPVTIKNPSPFPISITARILSEENVVSDDALIVMPGEEDVLVVRSDVSLNVLIYCLEGTSKAFSNEKFFELRLYERGDLTDVEQSFDPIARCND